MSKTFIKKNIKLSNEFDRYIIRKPDLMNRIPNKGWVIITVEGDEAFNKESRALAENINPQRGRVVEARKKGSTWRLHDFAAC
ncbi:hypothetical protein BK004_01915 [bacterium CG10_46_32]|nr:MAG: hypothetical protein BK004_01915 [bacterium CG10_46_32]PIR56192.1 MAG: hypothetical protein COU73_01945 [Parcubacteria group bacterium CG10_big_fil_rev_8_21_14_0_10_46_32]